MSGDRVAIQIQENLTKRLIELYEKNSTEDWKWFEEYLVYDNARLSQCLIITGNALRDNIALQIGIYSLKWLIELQTSQRGYFSPIGSDEWYN